MKRRAAVLILVAIAVPLPALGQEAPEPIRLFLSGGAGLGSHGTLHGSASLSDRTGEYILRGTLGFDLAFTADFAFGGFTKELSELALLYGRRTSWERGWARVALGVGRTTIDDPDPVGPGGEPTTSAYGLAGQAGVVWTLARSFGLGLTGVGNLNDLRPFGAVTLSVHVGRVR